MSCKEIQRATPRRRINQFAKIDSNLKDIVRRFSLFFFSSSIDVAPRFSSSSLIFPATGHSLILEEEKEPNYLNAGVGEYAVFNCDLDFPHETPIPYILQWNRDVSVVRPKKKIIFLSYALRNHGRKRYVHFIPLDLFTCRLVTRFPAEIRDLSYPRRSATLVFFLSLSLHHRRTND